VNRTIRLELTKPLSESWETVGPHMRLLADATPKMLNSAYDALVACRVAGAPAVKAKLAPDTRGGSPEALAYQAVNLNIASLREWGSKGELSDGARRRYVDLEMPGGMVSAISRTAANAYSRRDQKRVSFASPRILVRAHESKLLSDDVGYILDVKLRSQGRVRFACAHSWGSDAETRTKIVSGEYDRGDCQLQYDKERRKWYALVSYECPDAEPAPDMDPGRVLVIHRGIRNALFPILSTAQYVRPLPGNTIVWRQRALRARMRDAQRMAAEELGGGAKGHGRSRRMQRYSVLEDKLSRVNHTWCQQAAAWVANLAVAKGCGTVVIEDYGGIAPAETRELRRVLDRSPLYELKRCIANRLESVRRKDGTTVRIILKEVSSIWISSKCPRCFDVLGYVEPGDHNTRTNVFHCQHCGYDRDADFVAAYWMLVCSGADMGPWMKKFEIERRLAGVGVEMKGAAE
jgi:hypothetical protein